MSPETRRWPGWDGLAGSVRRSSPLVFCQVGQGSGGRGRVTWGRRGKGNTHVVYVLCVHYFGVVFGTWGYLGVDISHTSKNLDLQRFSCLLSFPQPESPKDTWLSLSSILSCLVWVNHLSAAHASFTVLLFLKQFFFNNWSSVRWPWYIDWQRLVSRIRDTLAALTEVFSADSELPLCGHQSITGVSTKMQDDC